MWPQVSFGVNYRGWRSPNDGYILMLPLFLFTPLCQPESITPLFFYSLSALRNQFPCHLCSWWTREALPCDTQRRVLFRSNACAMHTPVLLLVVCPCCWCFSFPTLCRYRHLIEEALNFRNAHAGKPFVCPNIHWLDSHVTFVLGMQFWRQSWY